MQQQNSNQQSRSLNLQELKAKNKVDLQAICKEVLGEEPHESLTRQQLIDAIVAAQPAVDESAPAPSFFNESKMKVAPAETVEAPAAQPAAEINGPFYGNKDHDKKHLLPADWAKKVCVFQCQIDQMNGGVVEIPNTHQLQTYDPVQFTKLCADEKGKPNFFSESKMKVVVLHDPR